MNPRSRLEKAAKGNSEMTDYERYKKIEKLTFTALVILQTAIFLLSFPSSTKFSHT